MNIQIQSVSMTYPGGKAALREVSLSLGSPCLIGLLGPNGAGKSTLMKLMTAALLPTGGEIRVDGQPLSKAEKALKQKLGYLPQSFGLYDELRVYQFLDYMAALKGISPARAVVEWAMEAVNLTELRKKKIRTLSGGQRQRVGIAQAILGDPELLIFDEPTVGLDPEERIRMRNLFASLAREKLVILSTHIIDDVQSVCGQIAVINRGKILFSGSPEALTARARGHVGVWLGEPGEDCPLTVTSQTHTADGVLCRGVAGELPGFVRPAEPALEDAYIWMMQEGSV